MSQQDYQQAAAAAAAAAGFFTPFSNGFDRSSTAHQDPQQHYQHIAHQIRKEKLRLQGFHPPPHPPSLVGIDDDNDDQSAGAAALHHVYDSAGILSEMFNFPPAPPPPPPPQTELYGNREAMNAADSAVAMQLFLMNPNPRSPSPPPPPPAVSSTLHMLLPNPGSGGSFGQFTWGVVPDQETGDHSSSNPNEGRLSLSLSSSLEAAKAEELRMGDSASGLLYQTHHHPQHVHVGIGSSNPLGVVNLLRNSKYVKAAQELLEEFCSVGRGQFKRNKSNLPSNSNSHGGDGAGVSSSAAKDHQPQPALSAADRIEHQRRKVKLLSMLDEACKIFVYVFINFWFSNYLGNCIVKGLIEEIWCWENGNAGGSKIQPLLRADANGGEFIRGGDGVGGGGGIHGVGAEGDVEAFQVSEGRNSRAAEAKLRDVRGQRWGKSLWNNKGRDSKA